LAMEARNSNRENQFVTFPLGIPIKLRVLPAITAFGEKTYCDMYDYHYLKFPDPENPEKEKGVYIYCPKNYKEECPVCKRGFKLWDMGKEEDNKELQDIAKLFMPKRKVIARCIVRGQDEYQPMFFELRNSISDQITSSTTAGESILDLITGKDVVVTKVKKKANLTEVWTNITYNCSISGEKYALDKEQIEAILQNAVPFKTLHEKAIKPLEEIKHYAKLAVNYALGA
jgi:hypothetical protein